MCFVYSLIIEVFYLVMYFNIYIYIVWKNSVICVVILRRNCLVGRLYYYVLELFDWWFPIGKDIDNINCFLRQRVVHVLNGVLPNFRQNPQVSIYFRSLVNLLERVVYRFSNGLGCLVPCESLDGFSKTGTHLRARGGCHVSTFPDQGVTVALTTWEPEIYPGIIFQFFINLISILIL